MMVRLKSALCLKSGMDVPVINATMNEEARPELAMVFFESGVRGMLGHAVTILDEDCIRIRQVRTRAKKPRCVDRYRLGGFDRVPALRPSEAFSMISGESEVDGPDEGMKTVESRLFPAMPV